MFRAREKNLKQRKTTSLESPLTQDFRQILLSIPSILPSKYSSHNVEVLEYIPARTAVLTCQDWQLSTPNLPKLPSHLRGGAGVG